MNKNRQLGFGVIEVLVVLATVGLLGFIGWRVYEANQKASESPKFEKVGTVSEENKLPSGWVKYENKDLGFSFGYPEEWGDVKQASSPNTEGRTYEGGHYYFNFSKKEDFKVAAKTHDYKYTGLGMDAPIVNGYDNFDERYQQIQNEYSEIISKSDDKLVYVFAEGMQGTITTQGIVRLKKLPGLDFALSIPIDNFNLPEGAYDGLYSGATSPKKYLTQDQIKIVVKFAENVKDL